MVAVLYQKEPHIQDENMRIVLHPDAGTEGPLSPGLIYPEVTEAEMAMWKEWLPTEIKVHRIPVCRTRLKQLDAPAEVMGEFNWISHMNMFDEYMLRTPERQDQRDPLLLGRAGDTWYRLALWGESLLPIDQIRALVNKSLVIKRRVACRHSWYQAGSVFLASTGVVFCGYWNTGPLGFIATAIVIILCGILPAAIVTPENAQQNYLDRYRL